MGSGVCDYHPDLGIECLPRHDISKPYWRGIRYIKERNVSTKQLILLFQNICYKQ